MFKPLNFENIQETGENAGSRLGLWVSRELSWLMNGDL